MGKLDKANWPTLCLRMQNQTEVARGIRILKGEESLGKIRCIQFAYLSDNFDLGLDPVPLWARTLDDSPPWDSISLDRLYFKVYTFDAYMEKAKKAIGEKGNEDIRTIAEAMENCKLSIHVRFVFCNLSESSVILLANSLVKNSSLLGFTCLFNPCMVERSSDYISWHHAPASLAAQCVRDAVIRTRAPLEIWNNWKLEDDIVAERQRAKNYAVAEALSPDKIKVAEVVAPESPFGSGSGLSNELLKVDSGTSSVPAHLTSSSGSVDTHTSQQVILFLKQIALQVADLQNEVRSLREDLDSLHDQVRKV